MVFTDNSTGHRELFLFRHEFNLKRLLEMNDEITKNSTHVIRR